MEIIKQIMSWPVIVQGALGSALCWAVLTLGQKITTRLIGRLRKDKDTAEFFALCAWTHNEEYSEISRRGFFTCLYAAMHYTLKALIVAVVGLLFSSVIPIFTIVGYLFAMYFLFRALCYVPHLDSLGDVDKRLVEHFQSKNGKKDS